MKHFLYLFTLLLPLVSLQAQGNYSWLNAPSNSWEDADWDYNVSECQSLSCSELPEGITFEGNFLSCTTWTDKLGQNYLITSESEVQRKELKDMDIIRSSKDIFAVHYVVKDGNRKRLWKLLDYIHDCDFTPVVKFLHTPYITDIDHDGICETWLIYHVDCKSNAGFCGMKLILHIGEKKYALRGQSEFWELKQLAPPVQPDAAYKTLPRSIQECGIVIWQKHQVVEKY